MSVIDLGCEHSNGLVGRRSQRLAGSQTKSGAMARANYLGAFNRPAGELGAIVRADVFHREIRAAAAHHEDHVPANRDAIDLSLIQGRSGSGIDPGRRFVHIIPVCRRASSDIMVWFHGGSKTNSTSARGTVGTICTFSLTSCSRISPMPHPGAVRVILIATVRVESSFLATSHS